MTKAKFSYELEFIATMILFALSTILAYVSYLLLTDYVSREFAVIGGIAYAMLIMVIHLLMSIRYAIYHLHKTIEEIRFRRG